MQKTVALVLALGLWTQSLVWARQPFRAAQAMVVAQEPLATDVGVAVLKSGGNAVDAAVAVATALAVTYPFAGNLGGGGFMLVRMSDGRQAFFDFREKAPAAATANMYLDKDGKPTRDSVVGWRAPGVPGTLRGLELAHRKFGQQKWADLVAPAVRLAGEGFPVSYTLSQSLKSAGRPRAAAADSSILTAGGILTQNPESKRIFLREGRHYEPGEIFRQPELAATLQRVQKSGASEFYEGETAKRFAKEMASHGGLITLDDLKNYQAVERVPLVGTYRDTTIVTAPPPSTGGVGLLQMLNILEGTGYEKAGLGSAAATHYVAEAMRRYYADRGEFLGDADFVKIPLKSLISKEYARERRASIDPAKATPSSVIRQGQPAASESNETTHFSIVDAQGNAVALTYTLNGGYGCGITVAGLGFLLNNEMDDFTVKPGSPNMFGLIEGEANAIRAGKRPNSSMTPTIVLQNNQLHLVLGAPGGSRIPTGVLQVILNVTNFKMNIQDAVDQPRFHHQWQPDKLYTERGFSPDTLDLLRARGHNVEPNTFGVARVEAIQIETTPDGKRWLAAGQDGRGEGKATGY
ncbi:MAG: gamma-glutamyltransferase [Bryobacteraceae bacterium]|nr:gamma-glutamyltransferase [Bryobacteraceae bacterium]